MLAADVPVPPTTHPLRQRPPPGAFVSPVSLSLSASPLPDPRRARGPIRRRHHRREQQQQQQRYADRSVDMDALLCSLSATTTAEELHSLMSPYASAAAPRLSPRFMVSVLSRETDWRRSLALLDWMLDAADYAPSLPAYNVVLRNALRARQWRLAEGLVDEMERLRSVSPDRFTYSTLISALSRAGLLDAALRWLRRMEDDAVPPDLVLYSSLIHLARRLGDHPRAISLFARLRRSGIAPDLVAYNSMIHVYGKAGLLHDARRLLDEMRAEGSPAAPDTVSYSTLLAAYVEHGRYIEALSLFSEMRERRVQLDLTTCNIMIDAYGQLGMVREADRLFWSMRKLGIEPGLVSYNTLLRVYGEAEMFGEAIHLFRLMQRKEIPQNVVTYNTMIKIYGKSLEHEKAGNLIHEMLRSGVQPNSITYSTIISIWEKAGKLDRAAMLFQKIRSLGIKIDKVLYQTMIVAYERAGLVAHAKRLLHELSHPEDGVDKQTAISILAGAGRLEEAWRMFKEAVDAGEVKDVTVFRTMMELLARNKRHMNVVDVFEKMRMAGYLPDSETIGMALNAYGKLQDVGMAESVYREMQEEGCVFADQVHFQMLSLLGARRDFEEMELLLEKLESDPNINKKDLHLVAANVYERANRLDDASRIISKLVTRI